MKARPQNEQQHTLTTTTPNTTTTNNNRAADELIPQLAVAGSVTLVPGAGHYSFIDNFAKFNVLIEKVQALVVAAGPMGHASSSSLNLNALVADTGSDTGGLTVETFQIGGPGSDNENEEAQSHRSGDSATGTLKRRAVGEASAAPVAAAPPSKTVIEELFVF